MIDDDLIAVLKFLILQNVTLVAFSMGGSTFAIKLVRVGHLLKSSISQKQQHHALPNEKIFPIVLTRSQYMILSIKCMKAVPLCSEISAISSLPLLIRLPHNSRSGM
jgi:hypothetical protein